MPLDSVTENDFARTLRESSTRALLNARTAIDQELERRDVCEHGIQTGEWCEPCNREYKRAAREHYGEDG